MISPLKRFSEYFEVTDAQAEFVNTYFSGFFNMLAMCMMVVAILCAVISLFFMVAQLIHRLNGSTKYSGKKVQVAFVLLIVSLLICTGYGIKLYRGYAEIVNFQNMLENSGGLPDQVDEIEGGVR